MKIWPCVKGPAVTSEAVEEISRFHCFSHTASHK